ncbi:protein lin-28 homolog B [Engraulis encrasicolus]|uniref:protein lin-28 homolog B n=1 Tax=Engraulis encrasicolus TaxID=184585 RepID=UPI002FD5D42E
MAEGGASRGGGEVPATSPEQEARSPVQVLTGSGHCKWFNVRMGFGFISMTSNEEGAVDPPMDVFVHQSKLVMEGFRSLREGEAVEFSFQRSSKGLEALRVTGPRGGPCSGSERRPKGKAPPLKRKPKGDRCYNCGGLDHHAKECGLPPQPKKCHYCQSTNHMVAQCPHKANATTSSSSQDPQTSPESQGGRSSSSPLEGSSLAGDGDGDGDGDNPPQPAAQSPSSQPPLGHHGPSSRRRKP